MEEYHKQKETTNDLLANADLLEDNDVLAVSQSNGVFLDNMVGQYKDRKRPPAVE